MTASMWPQMVTALQSVFDAAVTVDVFDGIPITYGELSSGIAVGVEPSFEDGTAGAIRQSWRDAGPAPTAHREEFGEVICTVWAQSGDDDLAGVRSTVFDLLDSCCDSLHTITALGLPEVVSVLGMSEARPIQRRTTQGVICEVSFRVSYTAVFN